MRILPKVPPKLPGYFQDRGSNNQVGDMHMVIISLRYFYYFHYLFLGIIWVQLEGQLSRIHTNAWAYSSHYY